MPDDAWDRHEHLLFGRSPTPGDLLERHLARTGAAKAAREDPAAQLQVALLRDFLDVLRAALDDEHVDPDVARRVVERVIYGSVPSPAEVELRQTQQAQIVEYVVNHPPDPSWLRSPGSTLR